MKPKIPDNFEFSQQDSPAALEFQKRLLKVWFKKPMVMKWKEAGWKRSYWFGRVKAFR